MRLRTFTAVGYYLCLLLMTTLPAQANREGFTCPENWMKREGNCYGYFKKPLAFAEAEENCKERYGSSLVSIHSKEEACAIAKYVAKFKGNKDVWIGLHDPEKNDEWEWTDSTRLNAIAWVKNESENASEHCAQLRHKSNYVLWHSGNCRKKNPYICRRTPLNIVNKC